MLAAPIRNAFAGCSSAATYYPTKGDAIHAFNDALTEFGYRLNFDAFVDYNGNEGRAHHPVCDDCDKEVGCAVFSWYRMPSGCYEFIGYLA